MSSISLLHQEKKSYYSNLDGIVAGQIFFYLLPLVDEMFGLKIFGIIGISTCLFRILYNMIPLLQVLLCCNVGQERFFKRLVTLTNSLQTKRAIQHCNASSLFTYLL